MDERNFRPLVRKMGNCGPVWEFAHRDPDKEAALDAGLLHEWPVEVGYNTVTVTGHRGEDPGVVLDLGFRMGATWDRETTFSVLDALLQAVRWVWSDCED
ncbi:hypothetical protein INP57_01135 [Saccharopolyspora sp. HNM0986]|uniref:hypothetical protein n=1 Tax=Saccharopolyspora galaxeae TaxID=2781241 RepID=UPI00190BCD2A|nr:hypothetical protein [Saccharopolyspora sp. HNM0986]MBK0865407.1 hypothetical protein [Saccharopolyspora sp. HNM0986]